MRADTQHTNCIFKVTDTECDVRDHFSPCDVKLVVVGKLELVETNPYHGAYLHVQCLLFLTLSLLQLDTQHTLLYLITPPELDHLCCLTSN